MIKHIIIWNLKDEYSSSEKLEIKKEIKREIEALKGKIEGLIDIKVHINPLESSSGDLMLDSSFESVEALKYYASHPVHVKVANDFVRPHTASRACLDFEIN